MGNQMIKNDTLRDQDFQIYSQDSRLNLTLLINKYSKKQYILRKILIQKNNFILEETIKVRKIIQHPYVTPLIEYRYDLDKKNIYILFEVTFRTFQEMRMEKSCLKKYLTENELIDILHQITQGLNHLKKFGISHQSIRSSNLSVDNNNSVKIIDPLAKISLNNYNRVKSNLVNYPKEIYLSPQEFNFITNKIQPKKRFEYQSDMFSLGMVILEIGILKTLQDIYSITQGIRVVVLINYLHELQNKCGQRITKIVKKLLNFQPSNRLTLQQLESNLKILTENKQEHSKSTQTGTQQLFFNKPRQDHLMQVQKPMLSKVVQFNDIFQTSIKHQHKVSKSPIFKKSMSPKNFKKKMLAQQTSNLSSAIKKKLENLLQVSENLKSYEYSSASKPKKSIFNNEKQQNIKQHHRRNTLQLTSKLFYDKYQEDQSQHNKNEFEISSHLKLNQLSLKKSINIQSPQKNEKQLQNLFQSKINKQYQGNFSFAPDQQSKSKIMIESIVQYGFHNKFKQMEQKIMDNITTKNNSNNTSLKPSCFQTNYNLEFPSSQIQLMPSFTLQIKDYNSKLKMAKSRGNRHQSGDFIKTNIFKQMHVDLNNQSNFVYSKYQTARSKEQQYQCNSPNINKTQFQFEKTKINHNYLKRPKQPVASLLLLQKQLKSINNYEGDVIKGLKHGKGRFIFDDGVVYQGQWSFNKMHGKGKLFYQSGLLAYDGQWFRDKMQGFGSLNNEYPRKSTTIFFKNFNLSINTWNRYEGTFKNGMKHGTGKLFFVTGQYYQGQFKDNNIHGEGIFSSHQKSIQGKWQRGQLIKLY